MARQKKATHITEQNPFPKRLRGLMTENNSSQTELAKIVNCTRQAISLYATGQSTPDIDILLKIAQYFNVSTDYLLGLTDVKTPDIDIQAIHEKTGLSEKAIINLKYILRDGFGAWPKSKYVNMFLSHNELFVWFLNISRCLEFSEEYNPIENYNKGEYHTKHDALKREAEKIGNCKIVDEKEYQGFLLFESEHHLTLIMSSLMRELENAALK